MVSTEPLISVTLPNYNYGRFLREAIDSLLRQTYAHLEILFVDDGSTDDSRQIAEEVATRDSRFKPVFFERNRGVMAALDDAWGRAVGDLVYQFSSDDALCDAEFFRLGVQALRIHSAAAGFYGVAQTVSSDTEHVIGQIGSGLHEGFICPEEFMRGFLRGRVFVPGISSLWRRKRMLEIGGYMEELGPQADYFVNHVLPAQHGVVFVPRTFAKTRVAESRISYSSNATFEMSIQRFKLFECRMRAVIPLYLGQEEDWQIWRTAQVGALVVQTSSLQHSVTRIKLRLRNLLPTRVFRFINLAWRHTVGAMVRAAVNLSPRYRAFSKKWPEM